MFRIMTTDGVELGYVDQVNYIKINQNNGSFNSCSAEEAIGIAFQSKAYNINNSDVIKNTKSVIITKIDVGSTIQDMLKTIKELQHVCEDQRAIITEQDEAIIELFERLENR